MQSDLERAKQHASERADAARRRGREELEDAKSDIADRAERIADAVEATAEDVDTGGDGTVSEYGRSLASLVRRLAGGLRERDIDEFAQELSGFARRNPGLFLAGSVALGFGLSRFLKASARGSADESYEDYDDHDYDDMLARGDAPSDRDADAERLGAYEAETVATARQGEAPHSAPGAAS